MNEIWMECFGFPNYEVSNTGKMRRMKTGKEIVIAHDTRNYSVVRIWYNKKKYTKRIAKLVWQSFNQCECKQTIDHIDRNKMNNDLGNLRCISQKENSKNRAIYNGKNKYEITDDIKAEIMDKIKNKNYSLVQIWKEYKIPTNYMSVVLKRGTWNRFLDEQQPIQ